MRSERAAPVGAHRTSAHPHTSARAQPEKQQPERDWVHSKLGTSLFFTLFFSSFCMSCAERLCAFSILKCHLRGFAIVCPAWSSLFMHGAFDYSKASAEIQINTNM